MLLDVELPGCEAWTAEDLIEATTCNEGGDSGGLLHITGSNGRAWAVCIVHARVCTALCDSGGTTAGAYFPIDEILDDPADEDRGIRLVTN